MSDNIDFDKLAKVLYGSSIDKLDEKAKRLFEVAEKDEEIKGLLMEIGEKFNIIFNLYNSLQDLFLRLANKLDELNENDLAELMRKNANIFDQIVEFATSNDELATT